MTIEIPTKEPELIKTVESDFGSTIAQAIWLKIVNNQTWVERNIPLGFILHYFASQPVGSGLSVDPIDLDLWKFCDGSLISDADSPLNGQNVPDLRQRYLKGSATVGTVGGSNTTNLLHSHGGLTGVTDDRQPNFQADNNNDKATGNPHTHPIFADLSSVETIQPLTTDIHCYMRFK